MSFSFVCVAQRSCGVEYDLEKIKKSAPDEYKRIVDLEEFVKNYTSNSQQRIIDPNGTIIIPVIVHVLHGGAAVGTFDNISNAQVLSQIEVLNEDFRRLNADRINTPTPFQSVAADMNIEFRLACIDPSGNPTNGITRTNVGFRTFTVRYFNDDIRQNIDEFSTQIKFSSQGGKDAWDTSKYLNIWVCSLTGGDLGYAQRPTRYVDSPNTDGVVINFTAFGRVGSFLNSKTNKGRTTVHEIGHWLNLNHIWGNDDFCSDDGVSDTPLQGNPTDINQSGCPSFPRQSSFCNTTTNGEMFMNYMDYSKDECMNLFTQGQKARMRVNFLAGGARASFINSYFKIKDISSTACLVSGSTISLQNVHCLPVVWSVSGATIVSQSNQGITLSGNGRVTLTATSGNYTDTKTFDLGQAVITTNDFNVVFCKTHNYEFQNYVELVGNGFDPLSTTFEVEKITTNFGYYLVNDKVYIQPHTTGIIKFKVRALGYCGWSEWKFLQYSVTNCRSGGFFKVYPNPAKESLIVDFDINKENEKNQDQKRESLGDVKIELYNSYQKLVFETIFKEEEKEKKLKIDTIKFPNGVYYLKIINKKEVYTERIIIEN